jgi:DNA-cytosine methyltransferase
MKVLSLFSGVGGFDMGLENAGMETVFQCEWDKHANSILYKHWPDVPKWDDVSTLTGKHILAYAPVIDVVAWGSPCQDLSVAGKRAGLEGGRSGLFHEGIRIIKELQEETNGQYPRISIWENVVGALNSNGGADFGVILDEMAEAGAVAVEWSVLDAQYFGIPQRRRRVFVIAVFDPVLANRCPSPLLPVSESLPGHIAKGKQKRKSAATTLTEGVGADGEIVNAIGASLYHKSTVVNQDVNAGHLVTEGAILGSDIVGSLNTSDAKMISSQYVNENKCVVEPYVKSSRAQTSDDSETWIPGAVNPTLNSFDVGDTRATTAIIEELVLFENSFRDGARIAHDGVTQTLTSKMGTGGGNTPMIAIPIQDGREIEKNQNGLGVAEAGSPAYTLDQTGAQAVAFQYSGDRNNRSVSISEDVAYTLAANAQSKVQAVAYSIREDAKAGNFSATELDHANSLSALQPSPQSHHAQMFIAEPTMAVRRLTPLECERLMGWPDDHTRYKTDGTEQADTHRYKQAGNGVASPVAQWIAKHILAI